MPRPLSQAGNTVRDYALQMKHHEIVAMIDGHNARVLRVYHISPSLHTSIHRCLHGALSRIIYKARFTFSFRAQSALLQAHKDFAFVLFGARRCHFSALADAHKATAAEPCEEMPLTGLNHHGHHHGIILKRLVAGYAGAPFGHNFTVCMVQVNEERI